jgi:hypothetical protein
MIPMIVALGTTTVLATGLALATGANAGMSYALGRKCGRVLCCQLDRLETKGRELITPMIIGE